jgi:hypothetical protein
MLAIRALDKSARSSTGKMRVGRRVALAALLFMKLIPLLVCI